MREDIEVPGACTVRLLAIAAQAAYRVKKDNLIDPDYSEEYRQGLKILANHGYSINHSIAPQASEGTGTSPLAAVCLMPNDSQAPIVIAYRGTKTMDDVASDIRLGVAGVVDKQFRDAAFEFYRKVREANPEREIVITGHSLGGHLAQYVAAKAYNTDPLLVSKQPLVQVRTFNTAPVSTSHGEVFENNSQLLSQFVNYRLSSDLVSDLPLKQYYGNTFVFPCSKSWHSSHSMEAVITKGLPEEVLNQAVGTNHSSKPHNMLIELTNGLLHSYQSQVDGQFFSRFRAGARNVEAMQKELPAVLELTKNGKYDQAIEQLDALKQKMDGTMSKHFIDVLMDSTINVKITEQMYKSAKEVSAAKKERQLDMKAQFKELRNTLIAESAVENYTEENQRVGSP